MILATPNVWALKSVKRCSFFPEACFVMIVTLDKLLKQMLLADFLLLVYRILGSLSSEVEEEKNPWNILEEHGLLEEKKIGETLCEVLCNKRLYLRVSVYFF